MALSHVHCTLVNVISRLMLSHFNKLLFTKDQQVNFIGYCYNIVKFG